MISLRLFFVLAILIVVAAITGCVNEDRIRKKLLEKTPIGSDFEQVMAFCASSHIRCHRSETTGYLNQHTGKVVGVKSIWSTISERKDTPLSITSVSAYWGFDENGKLIDIWVWKTIDAP